MKEEATYTTKSLIELFTQLQNDGYEAVNLKLITDLIERDAKPPLAINTVGRLKEELSNYADDTVILWQFYTEDHAFINGELWAGISKELMTNTEFLEDHHEFLNGWFDSAERKLEEGDNN